MTMTGSIEDYQKVYLPMLRRVMPNIIAQNIVGVQPMTGPTGKIWGKTTRARYIDDRPRMAYVEMDLYQYKNFLRLNDRKHRQYEADFLKARYPYIDRPNGHINTSNIDVMDWLDMTMPNRWVYFSGWAPRIYFENERDKMLFILRWS